MINTTLPAPACSAPMCFDRPRARGLCNKHYQQWRRGEPVPADVSMQSRPTGALTTIEVVERVGCTFRQLDYWRRCGYVTPAVSPKGSGSYVFWSPEDVARVERAVARIAWGLTVDAAWRESDPGPLPP